MTTIKDIYSGAVNLINQLIRKESTAQGHYLTGALEDSLDARFKKVGKAEVMEGVAIKYAQYVNDGTRPEKATYKQAPFLIDYFFKRGFGPAAVSMAFATINKWKKEGMSTQASKRFSQTGARQNMVEAAFVGGAVQIDEYMGNSFDFAINEKYLKEKSETI